jgi:hypothetical protein
MREEDKVMTDQIRTSSVPGYAAVVGDLVESRAHGDRSALQSTLQAALDQANAQVPNIHGFHVTVGDEFQGLFADLTSAARAILLVRLRLKGKADARFGVGWGLLSVFDASAAPFRQDGPAWWRAREALDLVAEKMKRREAPRGLRTMLVVDRPPRNRGSKEIVLRELPAPARMSSHAEGPVNAFFVCHDALVSRMDGRDARLLLALLSEETQTEVAEREGISQSAISQRNQRSGAYAIRESHSLLQEATR